MTRKSSVRLDIQALRALAVAAVVTYHVWPETLPGGFVGVDVFFVVSGFLISQHLLREHEATGTIQLARFWARRARLLPAAFTVLALTTIASWVWLPAARLAGLPRHVAAAALYVENWLLAGDSVDYLAAAKPPGPVQHFWSLSVEEQFVPRLAADHRRHRSPRAAPHEEGDPGNHGCSRRGIARVFAVANRSRSSACVLCHADARLGVWGRALLALAPQLGAGPRVRARGSRGVDSQ